MASPPDPSPGLRRVRATLPIKGGKGAYGGGAAWVPAFAGMSGYGGVRTDRLTFFGTTLAHASRTSSASSAASRWLRST
ncbi:MAG: hypothetical protein JWP50_381 [Phenylobacterium sp.]|nr:hypothetical protein [Phenylobacterium sp.]